MLPHTIVAPSVRATQETVLRERDCFASFPHLVDVLNALPAPALVLNQQWQIVFANLGLFDLIGKREQIPSSEWITALLGKRFGEAANCVHSQENPHGCGHSHSCSTCGAALAIFTAQQGNRNSQECRMLRDCKPEPNDALDLRVTASPLPISGEKFMLVAVENISAEKRRQALERIFFHDLLNTATGMQGLATLISELNTEENEIKSLVGILRYSSEQLVDEINAQRTLNAAERNDLTAFPETIELLPFVQKIAMSYSAHDVARDRCLRISPESRIAVVQTDASLLRRVLINLLKNGLESSNRGETVTLKILPVGEFVQISIHNSAVMTEEVHAQIFTRSFSTRGQGRGLGTYGVKLITERYLNGKVRFTSQQPEGTVFTVTLPAKWTAA